MFDQIHSVLDIIRTSFHEKEVISGYTHEQFERLNEEYKRRDDGAYEMFLQRIYDDC